MIPMTVFEAFFLNLLVLGLALLLDQISGEPPERIHPTVWMGHVVSYLKPRFRSKTPQKTRIGGCVLWVVCVTGFAGPTIAVVALAEKYLGAVGYVLVSTIILKTSFALKSWDSHMIPVAEALESNNMQEARRLCQKTVRRDLSNADEQHVISATVETIAEGVVDGYTSPIFYFALFAAPGAIAYRMINTLDSMVGYKDEEHVDLGWFSAKMDTVANYIPARISAFVMLLASALVNENWKRAKDVLSRYRGTLESLNAGWPMSAMAGALGVKLEKIGHYTIGEAYETLEARHVYRALRIMKTTCTVFALLVVVPLDFGSQLVQRLMVII